MERLNEDENVQLVLPTSGPNLPRAPLECYVLAAAGRTVMLEAVDKMVASRLPESVDNVLVTFHDGEALVALKGMLIADPNPGDFHFIVAPHEGIWRTRVTQATLRIPITVQKVGSERRVSGYAVRMSSRLLVAQCSTDLRQGDPVEVGLLPTEEHTVVLPEGVVTVAGRVQEIDGGLLAIDFDPLSATANRSAITRFVVEARRAARVRGQNRMLVLAADGPAI